MTRDLKPTTVRVRGYLTHLLLKGDLSWEAWLLKNAAKFYGYPYFTFYLEEFFCAHMYIGRIVGSNCAISVWMCLC